MSLRSIRLAAGLIITSLALNLAPAAPALADGMAPTPKRHHTRHWHAPRVVTKVVYVPYTTGCGCAAYAAIPRYYIPYSDGHYGTGYYRPFYSDVYAPYYRRSLWRSARLGYRSAYWGHRRYR
jgi:hypothetical protein